MTRLFATSTAMLGFATSAAWASAPAPGPLAGAMGPAGLAVAAVAYGGYWVFKRRGKK